MTVFAILYGFFSGGFLTISSTALASTSPNLTDVGWVFVFPVFPLLNHVVRLRIGIACFVISLGLLTGNPIGGGLLAPPKELWWRPLTFAFVSGFVLIRLDWMNLYAQGYISCGGSVPRDMPAAYGSSQRSTIRLIVNRTIIKDTSI